MESFRGFAFFEGGLSGLEQGGNGFAGDVGFETIANHEAKSAIVRIEAEQDVLVGFEAGFVGRESGGVEEPEQVCREVEFRFEVSEDDIEVRFGKGSFERGNGFFEGPLFSFGKGFGGVGEASIE